MTTDNLGDGLEMKQMGVTDEQVERAGKAIWKDAWISSELDRRLVRAALTAALPAMVEEAVKGDDDNAWDRIRNDPELANARRKLSIHEIRLIIVHAQARHDAALRAVLSEPHGCRFCDYGSLRNPKKDHDETCGFDMASKLVGKSLPAPPTARSLP